MLSQVDRHFVEMIRSARSIRITVNIGGEEELSLVFKDKDDIRKLRNDIGLAVQDYLNKVKR